MRHTAGLLSLCISCLAHFAGLENGCLPLNGLVAMVEIHLVKLIFAFGEYRKFGLIFSNGLLLLSEYCFYFTGKLLGKIISCMSMIPLFFLFHKRSISDLITAACRKRCFS